MASSIASADKLQPIDRNDFCKKTIYQSKHLETGKPANGERLIREFRLSLQLTRRIGGCL